MGNSRANREFDEGIGDWVYLDQDESEFVFFAWPDWSIESVDNFIDGLQGVALSEDVISYLREIRHDALQAYITKDVRLMEAHCRALDEACRRAGMLDAAKAGVIHQKSQKRKAQLPRSARADNGETLRDVIDRLAVRHSDLSAKELWNLFLGELDDLGLDPESVETDPNPRKWHVEYNYNDRRKPLTFGSFQTKLSKLRAKKSI